MDSGYSDNSTTVCNNDEFHGDRFLEFLIKIWRSLYCNLHLMNDFYYAIFINESSFEIMEDHMELELQKRKS